MTFPDEDHPEFIDDCLVEERMDHLNKHSGVVYNKRHYKELQKRVADFVDEYAVDLKRKKSSKQYKDAIADLCVLFCDLFILVCISFFYNYSDTGSNVVY